VPETRPTEEDQTEPAKPEAAPIEPEADAPVPMPRDRPAEDTPETPAATEPPAPPSKDDAAPKAAPPVDNSQPAAPAAPEAAAPPEPPRIYQTACPALTMGAVEGKALPPIDDGQCHAQSPLSLTAVSVNGRMVPVSGEVVTDCAMASMLPAWAAQVDGYLWAKDNTRLKGINVGTSYMCRNRVGGASTDKLSEHGFADALDVVGFNLEDGRSIDVASGWPGSPEQGAQLFRHAHDAACSLFMTTLGPEANAEHHDHLHLDMGCHGKTCTARLCE
jgi:hypothetical protein